MKKTETRKPKYRLVYEHIHEAIVTGTYKAGEQIPSETVLVRQFDTSRPTVSRALRDLEHAGFVERRRGSGTYVRLPRDIQGGLLGLLVPGLGLGEFFEPICDEIAQSVHAHNFTLLWGRSSLDEAASKKQQAERLCRQYIQHKAAGVFFAPVDLASGMDDTNHRIADALDRAGIAVVLLDRDVAKFPQRSKFDVVGIDNRRAGYVLAEHLLRHGCRRIGFVAPSWSAPTIDERIAGYRESLLHHGLHPEPEWVHCGDMDDAQFLRNLTEPQLLEAYICANDYSAARLMQHLLKQETQIPQDVCVVGVNDLQYAKLLPVPLTTVRQPCRELGSAAVAAMVQRIENRNMPARNIQLDFKLVVRESSVRKPAS